MIKVTVDKSAWLKLKKELNKADDYKLSCGFFPDAQYGPENDNLPVATVAMFMEEGDPVKYPPRPFIRMGFVPRLNSKEYQAVFKQAIDSVMSGKSTFKAAYNQIGPILKTGLQNEIISWNTPPNSPQTVADKGFNDPLIDSGKMLESVDYKVERGSD